MKGRLYEYKGRRVRAKNKEQANRLLGNPLGYKDLTGIRKVKEGGV